ncbi:MAG: outer membrane beta-barrel family protein [Pelobium sp.]
MKKLLTLLFLALFCLFANAQQAKIKGTILDSASNVNLKNASISILQAKDSILVKFTRATENGDFSINNLKTGNYLMLVTYPDYADYVEDFKLDEANPTKDFGKVNLFLKSRLLQEVIFKGEAVQVRIKGDTTEFDAKTFKVQPNAKVEDLLKQLPGITVDKDGKITAQGETVNRVLVDGEEFFGDDPTLVTKNLRSDMIDKVQLYDDKSENAKFTGIDDGLKSKTINLTLKEDKKKGIFGKLDAGYGDDDYYSTQGLINIFNKKQKLSAYSTYGNTTRTGLDWQTSQKAGLGNSNIQINDDGGISVSYGGGNDAFSGESFYGEGIPKILNTGIHYENKWKADKHALNLDYKYGSFDNMGFKNTINQNNLPNNLLVNNTNNNFDNSLTQNKLNLSYDFKIDTSSNIKVTLENYVRNKGNNSTTLSSGFSNNNVLINDGLRNFNEDVKENRLATTLFYGKKFKKPGRTLTFRFNQSYDGSESNGILNSNINFYDPNNQIDSVDVVNQLKDNHQENENYKTSLTLTEKLSKTLSLSSNYDFGLTKSYSKLNSLNQDGSGNYTQLDPLYSNNLDYKITTQQGGLSLGYKKDKTNLTVGSKLAFANIRQDNLITSAIFERDFVNFVPSANFQYKFNKQKSFNFGYNGNTKQPSVNQLQPVLNNNDPLNITLGNKDLDIAFSNRFNLSYNSYKVLTSTGFYMYASYGFVSNEIVSNISTSGSGFSTSTYQNLKDKKPNNFYAYIDYNSKIGKSKYQYGIGLNGNGNTYYNISNNQLNQNKSYNFSPQISISKYSDKLSLSINVVPGYQINKSSLQTQRNASGYTFNSYFYFDVKLPKKVHLNMDANYEFQEASSSFNTNFDKFIINTTISKSFLEKENIKLSLSGNDLLNENIGFTRSAYGNNITQTSYNNIQRYFLLSLSWDFSKFGSKK